MSICINGEFFNPNDAKISVFDHGLLYGDGVFDTIAAVNGQIWWLDEHLNRLIEGCNSIFLEHPWSKSELTELMSVIALVNLVSNHSSEEYIRHIAFYLLIKIKEILK